MRLAHRVWPAEFNWLRLVRPQVTFPRSIRTLEVDLPADSGELEFSLAWKRDGLVSHDVEDDSHSATAWRRN